MFGDAVSWLSSDGKKILSTLTSEFTSAIAGILTGLDTWLNKKGGKQKITNFITTLLGGIASGLKKIKKSDIKKALGATGNAASTLANSLIGVVGGVVTAVKNSLTSEEAGSLGNQLTRLGKQTLQVMADALISYASSKKGLKQDLADLTSAIANAVGGAVAEGLDKSTNLDEKLGIQIGGDSTTNAKSNTASREGAPGLAEGGVVTGPGVFTVGEAGPEAVVPLDRLGTVMSNELNMRPVQPQSARRLQGTMKIIKEVKEVRVKPSEEFETTQKEISRDVVERKFTEQDARIERLQGRGQI